jgi:hypothetical protein
MNAGPGLAPDAAIVLGLASTAMPFARSPDAEAERWLRILRLHGKAGAVLSAIGVSEAPLDTPTAGGAGEPAVGAGEAAVGAGEASAGAGEAGGAGERGGGAPGGEGDAVARVTEHASRIAGQRGSDAIGTTDVLFAVMEVYGADFDRVLQAHGANRDEVVRRLGVEQPEPPSADPPPPQA